MKDHRSLFRQLLAGMYDAVLITDPSGHLLELNPRAKEFFGYETEEVMDSPIGRFIPGVTPAIVDRIRDGLGQARHMMLDANCMRKDSSTFFAEVTVSMIDLLNPGDLVFTVRNIERRRRQLELFRSEENACKVAQTALFACDSDGHFRFVNDSFVALFGFADQEEALKASYSEVLDDAPLADLFERALAGETASLRLAAQEDEEGERDVEVQLAPDVHGRKTVGVVGSVFRG